MRNLERHDMMAILKHCPFLLLLLFCVSYTYNTQTWQVGWHGLSIGTIALGIIGVIFLYKIKGLLHKTCIRKGIELSRVANKYDYYFVIVFLVTLFHGSWHGKNVVASPEGELNPAWTFTWSDETWQVPFLALLFVVIVLYKMYVLFNLLLDSKDNQ